MDRGEEQGYRCGNTTRERTYSRAVDGADLETRGVVGADLLLELFGVRKGVVPQVDVALERERELPVREELRGCVFVVQPGEDGLERIESAVKGEHDVGRGGLGFCHSHGSKYLSAYANGIARRTGR